jgi:hypothetical protein
MSRLDIGPHTHDKEVDPQTFDREVNVKAIVWTVGILVVVTIVAHVVVYGLIVGFNKFDDEREPQRSPLPAANVQAEPPLPHLQTKPEVELKTFQEDEKRLLVGIDKAMEEIARRGLGPEVVGGTPQAPTVVSPPQAPPAPATERR